MPYVKQSDRTKYEKMIVSCPNISSKGELEYIIYCLMKIYMIDKEYRYSTLHDCVYACIHAGEEFKRRYLDKREDEAIKENGDII